MVWYFALLAIAVPIIVVLAKKYYAEKKANVLNAIGPILTITFCAQNVA